MSPVPLRICCREITTADFNGVVNLLRSGFPARARSFWIRALNRLSEHATPAGLPKYGYLLEVNGALIGVLLLISATIDINGDAKFRSNVSSWFVEPEYRSYAALLASRALRHKHVTYFNITPHQRTLPILEAQGFIQYCRGRFLTFPSLFRAERGSRIKVVSPSAWLDEDFPSFESNLLLNHAGYGSISVICSSNGRSHPFVFLPLRKAGVLPYAYLAYCRQLEEFVRFAGSLGRFLAWYGFPLVVLDSNGPIKELIGGYFDDAPKYFKGPDQPRLGDMAYSERVMFGF